MSDKDIPTISPLWTRILLYLNQDTHIGGITGEQLIDAFPTENYQDMIQAVQYLIDKKYINDFMSFTANDNS